MVRELWRTPLHVGQHCGIILRIITEYKYVCTYGVLLSSMEWIYWLSAQLTPGYMYVLRSTASRDSQIHIRIANPLCLLRYLLLLRSTTVRPR